VGWLLGSVLFCLGARMMWAGVYAPMSLSWYCDCAVDEAVEAEPLEAVGDDILFSLSTVAKGEVR
jgi:hypothetical protein